MKNFNYTARDKSGATKRGSLKAPDRNAAMQELSAQGMVPLSITEGAATKTSGVGFKPVYALYAGAVLILAVWLGMKYIVTPTPQKKSPVKRERVQPPPKKEVIPQIKPVVTNVVVEPIKLETNQPAPPIPVSTNSLEYRIAQQEGRIDEEGKIIPKPQAYKSGAEQVLNMIMNKQLGDVPPPLPTLHPSERTNIVAILGRDIVVYDEDSEKSLQQKANVAQAKQLMKDYIAKGGTPEEFLRYFRDELAKAYKEWMTTQKTLMELSKTDREAALKYAEEQGKILAEKGIKPLVLPVGLDDITP
jgi:hypothetical protein